MSRADIWSSANCMQKNSSFHHDPFVRLKFSVRKVQCDFLQSRESHVAKAAMRRNRPLSAEEIFHPDTPDCFPTANRTFVTRIGGDFQANTSN